MARTAREWERCLAAAEAERAAAAARERDAKAKMDDVLARAIQLHQRIVDLEQQHADDAAEYVRVTGANATLERLRAEDVAEIARLKALGYWSLRKKILVGIGCALTGALTGAGAMRLATHVRR